MSHLRPQPRCLWRALLAAWIGLLCATLTARCQNADFEAANRLYEQGQFAEAAAGYQKLIDAGQASAAVLFNLGNAWFKSGKIGRAVVAYRQAASLAPRDPDVVANLQFARNQVQGPRVLPAAWQRWLGKLSLNEWSWLAGIAVWVWFLLQTLLQFRPAWKRSARGAVIAATVFALLALGGFTAAFADARATRLAVIVEPEVVVRHGPLPESPIAFTAYDGAELRWTDQKDDWVQVSAGPRRIGWVQKSQVALFHPLKMS
ncbi:MAG TPA: tetratricopeptide repeat protein [Candidatus Paceibacterota bacterium]|nr:tetratricopeptide repeat protein [Candidatus Paceibacterota bacterium]